MFTLVSAWTPSFSEMKGKNFALEMPESFS
jgi:hypothetical protein